MAQIMPIKGLRYNSKKLDDLAQVVTPPYDVISPVAQKGYYAKHPLNIIRLEYGEKFNDDTETENQYTRGAKTFQEWLDQKILVSEDQPALYRYRQTYLLEGKKKVRTGFICAVKIEPYESGMILPHEETLPKHKADRLALMQACHANFSPIFGLYADGARTADKLLYSGVPSEPDVTFTDEDGITHTLDVVQDEEIIQKVQEDLQTRRIFIADGHHRYETALNYRNLCRQEQGLTDEAAEQPFDYVLMTLVNLYDPGLVVLPTHRLIKNVEHFNVEKLVASLKEDFIVEEYALNQDGKNLADFMAAIYHQAGFDLGLGIEHRRAYGLYVGNGKGYLVSLVSENTLERLMEDKKHSLIWQGLDVSVLHTTILERLLGIGGEARANETNLTYTRDELETLKAVDNGEYQCAFFMNPTLMDEVTAIAIGGEKMPQKSTFFYPKLITGLVINHLK